MRCNDGLIILWVSTVGAVIYYIIFFFIIWQAISLFHFWVNFITNLPILNRGIFRSTLTFHIREALNWYQQYKKVIHRYHKHKYTHPLLIVFIHITASSKVECKTNSSPRSSVRCMDCIHAQSFHPPIQFNSEVAVICYE